MSAGREHLLAMTTCPDAESAERLASALVEARAAACVNVISGLRSVYRWQGEVSTDAECLLLMKTTRRAWPELERLVLAQHPYELPELVAVPVDSGSEAYLAWIDESTTA